MAKRYYFWGKLIKHSLCCYQSLFSSYYQPIVQGNSPCNVDPIFNVMLVPGILHCTKVFFTVFQSKFFFDVKTGIGSFPKRFWREAVV
jgi:hypothetical protein